MDVVNNLIRACLAFLAAIALSYQAGGTGAAFEKAIGRVVNREFLEATRRPAFNMGSEAWNTGWM